MSQFFAMTLKIV